MFLNYVNSIPNSKAISFVSVIFWMTFQKFQSLWIIVTDLFNMGVFQLYLDWNQVPFWEGTNLLARASSVASI